MQIQIDKKYILYVGLGIVLIFLWWYVFSIGKDVSDQRNRADAVAGELDQTRKQLQDTAAGLKNLQQTIDRNIRTVERTETIVREVQSRTANDAAILAESSKLIDDSQRIISTVRQRGAGETNKTAP